MKWVCTKTGELFIVYGHTRPLRPARDANDSHLPQNPLTDWRAVAVISTTSIHLLQALPTMLPEPSTATAGNHSRNDKPHSHSEFRRNDSDYPQEPGTPDALNPMFDFAHSTDTEHMSTIGVTHPWASKRAGYPAGPDKGSRGGYAFEEITPRLHRSSVNPDRPSMEMITTAKQQQSSI